MNVLEQRIQAVLTSIQQSNNGLTLNEIRDIHGVSYHTGRNYVNELVKRRKVQATSTMRERAQVFTSANPSRTPKWHEKPLWHYVAKQNASPDAIHGASLAWRFIVWRIGDLYELALGNINGTPVTKKDLVSIREKFINAKANLIDLMDLLDILIDNDALWEPATVSKVLVTDAGSGVSVNEITDVVIALRARVVALGRGL